jgi:serine protein kinase
VKRTCRSRSTWSPVAAIPCDTPTQRSALLAAIGEPQMIDTAKDPRLGRIFLNRTIRVYPAFAGFYGMEETIERIVSFFRHAAQGLEERKQILYLLGPVGGGKSSLAERLKSLMEVHPIYVLKAGDDLSREPAGSVRSGGDGTDHRGTLRHPAAALERAHESVVPQAAGGARRRHLPLPRRQDPALAPAPDGNENNQEISSLVGKVDISKVDREQSMHNAGRSLSVLRISVISPKQ